MLNLYGLNPDQISSGHRVYAMPANDHVLVISQQILKAAHDLDADSEAVALALANVLASMAITLDQQLPAAARISIESRLDAFADEVKRRYLGMQACAEIKN